MQYIVVDQLQKVIAITNKCGGSSIRKQLLIDLYGISEVTKLSRKKEDIYQIVKRLFRVNKDISSIPKSYRYEWYVRDPFYRILSCFINRKILIDSGHPYLTFRDFVFNLNYFINTSNNIRYHTHNQTDNYVEAPWNIIDIKNVKFSFKVNSNTTKYTLGKRVGAWNISSEKLLTDNQTYSQLSFYSLEISNKIREIYKEDYKFLTGKIKLI